MLKIILAHVIIISAVFAVVAHRVPAVLAILGALALLIAMIFNPFKLSAESLPQGFVEKKVKVGKVVLNYAEGPDNGPPLLFIPGQAEFWQGYKLVIPAFSRKYHVFAVDIRGHGKSTRTPGHYSYNLIGKDLKGFLEKVVKKPAIVSGLSSGAILAIWLAANAPKSVSAIISEDPPLFSSMYPRIKKERYLHYMFETMVDSLGKPERDIKGFFLRQGIPIEGKKELLMMPSFIASYISTSFELNKRFRPSKKYDLLNAEFKERAGLKFISEYDVDFSKATIDGRLSKGFDPMGALRKIRCPMLLIHAKWSRHKTWGLIGAMDDDDAGIVRSTVRSLKYVRVDSFHDVHLAKPKIFVKVVADYLDGLN
jgi:pimeloyl-ACP methyl ester carboxylesterase